MSVSNHRAHEYSYVYHLTSRIAHRVFILKEDERNDLIQMIRRASQFCGIKLLAWCIMTNHFHLLIHLPFPEPLSDEDVLSRYALLKGSKGRENIEAQLASWKASDVAGENRCQEWFDRQRERMYNIGEFMKIVKQWFTEEYNRRNAHVGTLWESAYHERVVMPKNKGIERCAAYIHLNPIRGAICTGYTEYTWSSMTSLAKGDEMALEGMRYIYGANDVSADELMSRQTLLMDEILEEEKRHRAEEIARRRMAGYDVPCDPLTNEAMIALAVAQRERMLDAGVEINEEKKKYQRCEQKRKDAELRIIQLIKEDPRIPSTEIAKKTSISLPTLYNYLRGLSERGVISRTARGSRWVLSEL